MGKPLAVDLAPGVWRFRLIGDWVNGFCFRDDDGQVTLLDMGLSSHGPKVIAALRSVGSDVSDVTRLMLTHAHPDHAGGAAHVSEATGRGVDVHRQDGEYAAAGTSPPQRGLPWLGPLGRRLGNPTYPRVRVASEFADGDLLPVAGGLRVIHTPGHSPGHCSFLHEPSGCLITGDALFNVRRVRWPVKAFCSDFAMTQKTAHRLAETEYDVAAFTHGPELRGDSREEIRRFLARHPV